MKINEDRVLRMLKAQRKRRAMYGFTWYGGTAVYAVARHFAISCQQVRDIVAKRKQS